MELFYLCTIRLVIQLLLHVDARDVVSSLLDSVEDITCTMPFLLLNTIGFIQCQRECIRYSICGVLQFKTAQLECRLYINNNCVTSSDHALYRRRTDINESIYRGCGLEECPTVSCIRLRSGRPTCVFDRVTTQYNSTGASFVEVDGVLFGIHINQFLAADRAQNFCVSYGGRLAILNTPRKIWMLSTAMQANQLSHAYIGVYKISGEVKWATGEPLQSTSVTIETEDQGCFVVYNYGTLADTKCELWWNFICEVIS